MVVSQFSSRIVLGCSRFTRHPSLSDDKKSKWLMTCCDVITVFVVVLLSMYKRRVTNNRIITFLVLIKASGTPSVTEEVHGSKPPNKEYSEPAVAEWMLEFMWFILKASICILYFRTSSSNSFLSVYVQICDKFICGYGLCIHTAHTGCPSLMPYRPNRRLCHLYWCNVNIMSN
jgi:hypothetical protein